MAISVNVNGRDVKFEASDVQLLFSAGRAQQWGQYPHLRWTADKDYKVIFVSHAAWNGASTPSISGCSWAKTTSSTCHKGPSGDGYSAVSCVAVNVPKGTRVSASETIASHLHIFGIE